MTSITILLPGVVYSSNKNAFIKLRDKYNVKNWDGTSWSNSDVLLTTSFQKAALRNSQPHDYDGDILILSGNLDSKFVTELISLSKDIGGKVERNEVVSNVEEEQEIIEQVAEPCFNMKLERRIEAELEGERIRLKFAGVDPKFTKKWLNLHEKHLLKLYS